MSKFGIPLRNGVSVGITAGVGTNSLTALAQAILRSFGTGASEYLFASPGTLWQDAAGTVPATAVNDPIGKATDQINSNSATQATAINRPTVQRDGGGRFYASFNGTNSSLALASVPFQMADDHAVVMCVRLFGVAGDQCLFELSDGTSKRAASVRVNAASINVMWFDGSVAAQPYYVTPAVDGSVYVITAWKIGSTYSIRVNSVDGVAVTPTLTPYTGTQARIGSRCDNTEYTSSNIYDVIPIKGTVTDAQLLVLEKAAGLRAGLVI